jgi:hypothetical protein
MFVIEIRASELTGGIGGIFLVRGGAFLLSNSPEISANSGGPPVPATAVRSAPAARFAQAHVEKRGFRDMGARRPTHSGDDLNRASLDFPRSTMADTRRRQPTFQIPVDGTATGRCTPRKQNLRISVALLRDPLIFSFQPKNAFFHKRLITGHRRAAFWMRSLKRTQIIIPRAPQLLFLIISDTTVGDVRMFGQFKKNNGFRKILLTGYVAEVKTP